MQTIRFRYIPPYEYHTPLMHLPIERTLIEAETPEQAWEKFLAGQLPEHREWFRREED